MSGSDQMISDGFPPTVSPLNRDTFALTLSTIGGAAPLAVPPPSFEPFGHAFGPRDWIALSLHFGKYFPFTTAPLGKRKVVRVSWSGAGAAGSVIVKVVRSDKPPRALWRSRFEYLPWNSTVCVVTAPAVGARSSAAAAASAAASNDVRMGGA